MQHKDIRVGGEYAYAHSTYGEPGRVVVTTKSVTKETGPYHRRRNVPALGIRVLSEDFYNLTGKEIVVEARKLVNTWAEHEAEREDAERVEAAKAERKERLKRDRAAALEKVKSLFHEHGIEVPDLEDWGSHGHYLVDIEQLAKALEDLERAARYAGHYDG